MKTMILVILTAAITNNYVLVKFLGMIKDFLELFFKFFSEFFLEKFG